MNYRIEKRQVQAVHANGTPITRTEEVRVPVLPKDWDQIAIRAVVTLVLALTLVSVTWSTVSIGSLLKGGVGYAAASIFDIAWAVCLILEWMARYEPRKRAFPRSLGWGLLVATMLSIGAHGVLMMHSWAAAVIGAGVSLFAKVLWLGVLQHIDRELSADDQALVAAEKSRAYTALALASTRRQVRKVEQYAAAELLAMENAGFTVPPAVELVDVEPEPVRTPQTLGRAAEAIRTDSEHGTQAAPETVAALEAARADGWSVQEVWQAAMAGRVPSGYPDAAVSGQVSRPQADQLRPQQPERVPEQGNGRLSLATAVQVLMNGGVTDRAQLELLLPSLVGGPFKPESLDREMRKHRT
ncbi:hypothetical protein ACFY4B_41960 [Kitasatospora sp. NPDC001261]|uniref:hypothetical protein n=1 Tax=Kitasatospora sp. NPDC001261 TaxID=3364012 RepID=UPI0036BCF224